MDKILQLIKQEEKRQEETLMMIPSENYTYPEVRYAVGSVLMHKYSEGQPGKRYYQGNAIIDEIESICKARALKTFNLKPTDWGVNVQALSGSPANLAVYNALLKPGEKILSLYLPDGGHLSHGWQTPTKKLTLVSKIYNVGFYHVDPETFLIDYNKLRQLAEEFKPKLIVSGGTAYPREIDHKKIGDIAKKVGAYYLADVAHEAGLIAGGVNKSPFSARGGQAYADVVTMTTHKTLRGPRGALIFSKKELSDKIDSSVFPGIQGGPHNEIIAGIAIALEKTKSKEFKNYAKQVVLNAQSLANKLIDLKIPVITNGTDKHLLLIDLRPLEINGAFAANALETAGIIVNKNTVPFDTASPFNPSGIRLGTPALTVRGMAEDEMEKIGEWITEIIVNPKSVLRIKKEVKTLCSKFPLNDNL